MALGIQPLSNIFECVCVCVLVEDRHVPNLCVRAYVCVCDLHLSGNNVGCNAV